MPGASDPFTFALVGAGNVGTAVARLLVEAGHRSVGVTSRTSSSADRAAEILGTEALDDVPEADAYLVGTPLDAVSSVAGDLSSAVDPSGRYFVHFAGAAGIAPLSDVVERGGYACALHPVQACPDVTSAVRNLPGSAWGVTTSPGAENWASSFVTDVRGVAVAIEETARELWHAAAVITSNGVAALLAGGEEILTRIGVRAPERVLGPLAGGTLANSVDGGGGGATLTGPVVRGELSTVAHHRRALGSVDPELAEFYVLVSRLIARSAQRAGRLDAALADQIEDALR